MYYVTPPRKQFSKKYSPKKQLRTPLVSLFSKLKLRFTYLFQIFRSKIRKIPPLFPLNTTSDNYDKVCVPVDVLDRITTSLLSKVILRLKFPFISQQFKIFFAKTYINPLFLFFPFNCKKSPMYKLLYALKHHSIAYLHEHVFLQAHFVRL